MTIVFTICSNNYLAQAKVLFKSLYQYNPDVKIYLGLVDKLDNTIDYSIENIEFEILSVDNLYIDNYDELLHKYSIVELNTSVKATYFKFFKQKHTDAEKIIYLDPDIKLFDSLAQLLSIMNKHSIVITPHICTQIKVDGHTPKEELFLNYGLYNLGFIAINFQFSESSQFLDWWENHLMANCFWKPEAGYFVDQLWINHVPIFFDHVLVLKDFGYNVGPWNLHERKLSKVGNSYYINDLTKLVFYHFSAYDYSVAKQFFRPYYSRYDYNNRQDLHNIYLDYHADLIESGVIHLSKVKFALASDAKNIVIPQKKSFFNFLRF